MVGDTVDDPEQFRDMSKQLLELLGADAMSRAREQRRAVTKAALLLGTFDLTRALDRVEAWIESLLHRELVDDAADMLRFAFICRTVHRCATLPGGDTILSRLRASLRSGQFDQFEDVLFEGEVAVYWLEQMRAVSVHFGDPAGHPDLWTHMRGGNISVRIALECKRIQPISSAARQLQLMWMRSRSGSRPCRRHTAA